MPAEAPSDDYIHLESEGACHQQDQVESFLVPGQATEVSDNYTGNEVFSESNDSFGERKWLL